MNLLKPTARLNIQRFYMVLVLHLCVLSVSQSKQRLLRYTVLTDWFCVIEVGSVYSAVRTETFYKPDTFRLCSVKGRL